MRQYLYIKCTASPITALSLQYQMTCLYGSCVAYLLKTMFPAVHKALYKFLLDF